MMTEPESEGCQDDPARSGNENVRYHLNSNNVVSDTIDGEVLAIRSDSGAYYSMRGPAATVWVALLSGASLGEVATAVAVHHDATAETTRGDIESFVASLAEALLVVEDATASGTVGELPAETRDTPWETPAFERYTDMRDLLLFDPIHEVQPSGWPARTSELE
jgi:hypothetical protein